MTDRPEPTALPQRGGADDPSAPPSQPATDPLVLERLADALRRETAPTAPGDRR